MFQILFVAAECEPFAKNGGLGDIIGSLPRELAKKGMDVRVVIPKYGFIAQKHKDEMEKVIDFKVGLNWRELYCGIEEIKKDGVHYYFIDNEDYFNREGMYGYYDDGERFAFFSKAVLEMIAAIETLKPDIIHCNDWHTALVPIFFTGLYRVVPYFSEMKTVLTIHNLKHQGNFELSVFDDLLGLTGYSELWNALEFYGRLNVLKGGILTADRVTTVSPNYAKEITGSFYGEGLDSVINTREDELIGILNGISDKKQVFHKGGNRTQIMPKKLADFKKEHKAELQKWMELPQREEVPVVGFVGRLVEQKGIDLTTYVMHELLKGDTQFVFLGAGESRYEDALRYFAKNNPDKVAVRTRIDEALAEKIFMGADLFIMPSMFEPCGLTQMMAMEYGTVPIVRETGGLKDTVNPYNQYTGEGNGFSFSNFNAHDFLGAVNFALSVYWDNGKEFAKISQNAAASEYGWNKSADEYIKLYDGLGIIKED